MPNPVSRTRCCIEAAENSDRKHEEKQSKLHFNNWRPIRHCFVSSETYCAWLFSHDNAMSRAPCMSDALPAYLSVPQ